MDADQTGKSPLYLLQMHVEKERARVLADMLEEAVDPQALAVSFFENDKDPSIWEVAAYYPDQPPSKAALENLATLFGQQLPLYDCTPVKQENWVRKVQENLVPVHAGRFIVHGSHDEAAVAHHPFALQIDAGEAFGTAHHGTTRGCLELLDQMLKYKNSGKILDLGTGTGILAIAAAKITGKSVFASDIDPVSIRTAKNNARVNHVVSLVKLKTGAGFVDFMTGRGAKRYDLVIANILAGPLTCMAQDFRCHTRTGSHIILSGILDHQARQVQARFRAAGFYLEDRISIEGWTSFCLIRY